MWWRIRRRARAGAAAGSNGGACEAGRQLERLEDRAGRLPPLYLAYVGDAVYELLVRRQLVRQVEGGMPAAELHRQAVARVRASAQADAMVRIMPRLTPEEREIVRRARNAHPRHRRPAGAKVWQYRSSSALEALFGYLFLSGRWQRMEDVFRWVQEGGGEGHWAVDPGSALGPGSAADGSSGAAGGNSGTPGGSSRAPGGRT